MAYQRTDRRIKLRFSDKKYNPTKENATAVTPVEKSTTPIVVMTEVHAAQMEGKAALMKTNATPIKPSVATT